MTHPERSPFARLGPRGFLGGNDPKFLREPTLRQATRPSGLGLPTDWNVEPWTAVAAAELAERLGYA
jgi:hypothetical protein